MVEFEKEVEKIYKLCEKFLRVVTSLGYECAFTHCIVAEIVDMADELKTKYNKV